MKEGSLFSDDEMMDKDAFGEMVYDPVYGYHTKEWLEDKRNGKKAIPYSAYSEYGDYGVGTSYKGQYDYDFNRKFSATSDTSFKSDWDKSAKTGDWSDWRGYEYYKKSTIDYRYVEQMANAFGVQHNVLVRTGTNWAMDIDNKTLVYNPTSLMFGTKADVICSLLHEIGHLRHTTSYKKLTSEYLKKYDTSAFNTLNCFEDYRIDKIMSNSYGGSAEVYESNEKIVEEIAQKYLLKSSEERDVRNMYVARVVSCLKCAISESHFKVILADDGVETTKELIKIFNLPVAEREKAVLDYAKETDDKGSLSDYLGGSILVKYGKKTSMLKEGTQELLRKTKDFIMETENLKSTEEVLSMLDTKIYPLIEDLLENFKQNKRDSEMFGSNASREITGTSEGSKEDRAVIRAKNSGNLITRKAGGDNSIPYEWKQGDYEALKSSVQSAIQSLTKRLQNVKAKDMTVQWKQDLRSGKLCIKNVYRYPSQRYDIFKKKRITEDRIRQFSFTIMIDSSGSMMGIKMINAVRGTIILAETFEKLQIPFEIITFDDKSKIMKEFSTEYKETKKKIGELAQYRGGGTVMMKGLELSTIEELPEKQKYMIIVSDGDTRHKGECELWVKQAKKSNVKSIGVGINSGGLSSIVGSENFTMIGDANELPEVFTNILKGLIKGH